MEQFPNPPSGLSTGSQLNPAVKLSESELTQQQLEELLDRIPKQLRFLVDPPKQTRGLDKFYWLDHNIGQAHRFFQSVRANLSKRLCRGGSGNN